MATQPDVDALDLATAELADNMVPTPDDLLGDIGPLGVMWYLHEMCGYALQFYTGALSAPEAGDVEDDSGPVRALGALTTAMGVINGACIQVSLLPPEAAGAPT
jgi:hypothetical protein